ncbi:uncharacterized protein C8Q71DRAFT_856188 [Rhodofomes roseus]|uniref:Uncharacterized protein n=1 Tax=Rhodofomes roseus TaxID=34475 RepID=A0ABQ8KJA9_9APHY|nr:uncharacterized protein C8Q71DRAFT_862832 [Rhodofomes roseus]XP_047780138.1 uncharacterized protein C8Q71DRAFT_856188 [Rhodofomes roseus]KAH9829978.1 hypothetical protein C8Q71DRAFT_862832 [Rhodofomes roseus]KAH9838223.1 hypothetical protein C8Q71DRAFT_856188 [Rhodofomes roseus]
MTHVPLATAVDIRHVYSEDTHTITLLILPGGPGPINLTLNLCRHNTTLNTDEHAVTSLIPSQSRIRRNRAFSDTATVPDSEPPEYPLSETQALVTVPIMADSDALAPLPTPCAMRTFSNATTEPDSERAREPITFRGHRVTGTRTLSPVAITGPESEPAASPASKISDQLAPSGSLGLGINPPRASSSDASESSVPNRTDWPLDSQGLPTTQAMYEMFGVPWPPPMEDGGMSDGWDDG